MTRGRILLASSGGGESLAAIARLVASHGVEVVTVTLDVGQDENASAVRERALAAGASKAHVLDARDEFAREYLAALLRAGALRADDAALHAALVRVLIAEKLADVGAMEGADWLAHGFREGTAACAHFERAVHVRRPGCVVRSTSPVDGAAGGGRQLASDPNAIGSGIRARTTLYAHSVMVAADVLGALAVPSKVVPIERCPDHPAFVEIAFEEGHPVAINRIDMPLVELFEVAATIAADHGIGRSVSERRSMDGAGSTEVLEAPAAVVLAAAYESLARTVLTPALFRLRKRLAGSYLDLIRQGEWHSDAREALDQFMFSAAKRVNGTVRLRLSRGRCSVVRGSMPGTRSDTATSGSDGSNSQAPARWSETTPTVSH